MTGGTACQWVNAINRIRFVHLMHYAPPPCHGMCIPQEQITCLATTQTKLNIPAVSAVLAHSNIWNKSPLKANHKVHVTFLTNIISHTLESFTLPFTAWTTNVWRHKFHVIPRFPVALTRKLMFQTSGSVSWQEFQQLLSSMLGFSFMFGTCTCKSNFKKLKREFLKFMHVK